MNPHCAGASSGETDAGVTTSTAASDTPGATTLTAATTSAATSTTLDSEQDAPLPAATINPGMRLTA